MRKKFLALSHSSVQRYAWPFYKSPCQNMPYQRLGRTYLIASTSASFVVHDSVPLSCRRTEAKEEGMFLLFLKNIQNRLTVIIKNWLCSVLCNISLHLIYFVHSTLYLLLPYSCVVPPSFPAGVQPRWIQGDSKVGMESASLEKYIFNHRYREIRNGQCSRKISGEKEAE